MIGAARHKLVVAEEDSGRRLDNFLTDAELVVSRSQAKMLIDGGHVLVGGEKRKAGYLVRLGDEVDVTIPPPAPSAAEPEPLDLEVVYEDETIIGVNKPPGMVVHPAPGRWQGTLVNALLYHWKAIGQMGCVRPGIVHRLDRDTSGIIVVAKDWAALDQLARQFRERTVGKRYLAIVRGVINRDSGIVDLPIGRHASKRHKMSVRSRRSRVAVTRFQVRERFKEATLLDIWPRTGRTHQIRVHMAAIGFPILGDTTYGRRAAQSKVVPRQALHALSLTFDHPQRGERITLSAPLWPDLAAVIEGLGGVGPQGGGEL